MAKEFFRSRYMDYSDSYVANMNSYHLGTSLMGECVNHFFMVEPVNGPAFYEYIKNMEKKRILPGIDWERYGDLRLMNTQTIIRTETDLSQILHRVCMKHGQP